MASGDVRRLIDMIKDQDGEGSGLDADLLRGDYINPRMFKNRIINGDFSIWQRGESASYASDAANLTAEGGYKSADRIYCANCRAGGQFTVSKSTMNNFNSFKVTVDSPPDNLTWDGTNKRHWNPYVYRFEGLHVADLFVKQSKITISFLFRSNVSGVFSLSFRKSGSPMDSFVTTFSYNDVDTVQKVVVTIPLDYNWSSDIVTDNRCGAELLLCGLGDCYSTSQIDTWQSGDYHSYSDCVNWAATAGNYIEIAELQLEEGEVATDFEHVPYDVQLMRCMRYYELSNPDVTVGEAFPRGQGVSISDRGNVYNCTICFKMPKRAVPSVNIWSENGTLGYITEDGDGLTIGDYQITGVDITKVFISDIETGNSTNNKYCWFNFDADAEL